MNELDKIYVWHAGTVKASNVTKALKQQTLEDDQDTIEEIENYPIPERIPVSQSLSGKNQPFVSNHSGYNYSGSENYEHDNKGDLMNYSGVEDMVVNAYIDHEGYQEGYDY